MRSQQLPPEATITATYVYHVHVCDLCGAKTALAWNQQPPLCVIGEFLHTLIRPAKLGEAIQDTSVDLERTLDRRMKGLDNLEESLTRLRGIIDRANEMLQPRP